MATGAATVGPAPGKGNGEASDSAQVAFYRRIELVIETYVKLCGHRRTLERGVGEVTLQASAAGTISARALAALAEDDEGRSECGERDAVRAAVRAKRARDVVEGGRLDVRVLGLATVVVDGNL